MLTDTGQGIWTNLHLIDTGPKILSRLGKLKTLTMSLFEIQLNIERAGFYLRPSCFSLRRISASFTLLGQDLVLNKKIK